MKIHYKTYFMWTTFLQCCIHITSDLKMWNVSKSTFVTYFISMYRLHFEHILPLQWVYKDTIATTLQKSYNCNNSVREFKNTFCILNVVVNCGLTYIQFNQLIRIETRIIWWTHCYCCCYYMSNISIQHEYSTHKYIIHLLIQACPLSVSIYCVKHTLLYPLLVNIIEVFAQLPVQIYISQN